MEYYMQAFSGEQVEIRGNPLFSLCDKGDIGGVNYSLHPDFRTPAIFLYDGYEGGIGLTRRVLDTPAEWIRSFREIIGGCASEDGCPSCVQDPQCGSANTPLDKKGALFFPGELLK
ncbi:MAG: DUF1998 domain-containing protein [Alphaproteobacteria bacterium]|uniref:DUF1998 domain-containing protein n=1 Tax=Candidatus Nitrobium versatile TaxID=2884831 RepID=A0A953SEN8_9BACT|nr:DUF1998 domain-containing protein [Candidatus Nitrobium versatile]